MQAHTATGQNGGTQVHQSCLQIPGGKMLGYMELKDSNKLTREYKN